MAQKRVNVSYDPDSHVMTFAPVAEGHDSTDIDLETVYPGAIAALGKTKNGAVAVLQFLHGVRQKGGDVYSSKEKVPDELVAKAVTAVFATIQGGNFSARGVGDGVGKSNDDILALIRLTEKTPEACREYYDGLTEDGIKELREHKQFALTKTKIRNERAAEKEAKLEAEAADSPALNF